MPRSDRARTEAEKFLWAFSVVLGQSCTAATGHSSSSSLYSQCRAVVFAIRPQSSLYTLFVPNFP
jgi:hypothetical protein